MRILGSRGLAQPLTVKRFSASDDVFAPGFNVMKVGTAAYDVRNNLYLLLTLHYKVFVYLNEWNHCIYPASLNQQCIYG